jgi:hypothetical protein
VLLGGSSRSWGSSAWGLLVNHMRNFLELLLAAQDIAWSAVLPTPDVHRKAAACVNIKLYHLGADCTHRRLRYSSIPYVQRGLLDDSTPFIMLHEARAELQWAKSCNTDLLQHEPAATEQRPALAFLADLTSQSLFICLTLFCGSCKFLASTYSSR